VGNRDPLERLADLEHLLAVLCSEAAHDELAPAAKLEEPFLGEELERLANGRLRHAQLLRDLAVGDDGADRVLAAEDSAAHVLVGLLAQPAGGRGSGPIGERAHRSYAASAAQKGNKVSLVKEISIVPTSLFLA
jgi:hypothetical protein